MSPYQSTHVYGPHGGYHREQYTTERGTTGGYHREGTTGRGTTWSGTTWRGTTGRGSTGRGSTGRGTMDLLQGIIGIIPQLQGKNTQNFMYVLYSKDILQTNLTFL